MRTKFRNAFDAVLKNGLPHVMLGNLVQQGLAFLTVLLVAKLLPPSEFALVRIALAYTAVALALATGGITAPILRYCADSIYSTVERRLLLAVGVRRVLVISFVVTVLVLIFILWCQSEADGSTVYAAYALQLPGLAVAGLFLVYLQAVQEFKLLAFWQVLIRLITMLISLAAVYFYGLPGLLVAAGFMAYLACVPLTLLARPLFREAKSVAVPPDFSSLAFYSVFGTAVTAVGQYSDLIILDLVGTSKDVVAVYSLASVFFFAALAIGGAVQSVVTPMFTALMHNPQQFKIKLLRWSFLLCMAAIPISAILVLLAFGVEAWFLGDEYAGLASILAVLMLKYVLWSTFAVGGAAMVGVGAIKQGAWIAVVTTFLTVVIGFPLCRHYGIYGAAWTQVAVALVSALLIWCVLIFETRALHHRFDASGAKNA